MSSPCHIEVILEEQKESVSMPTDSMAKKKA
jgi:hypothetical protein